MAMAMVTGVDTTSPTTETKEASEATDIMSTTDTMGEGFIMAADIMGGTTEDPAA
jgi:mannose/fructose-specific phosphotransferase system component IIA